MFTIFVIVFFEYVPKHILIKIKQDVRMKRDAYPGTVTGFLN